MFLTNSEGRANALLEKRLARLDPVRREHPDVDLRPRIIEARAQETLAMVLHLDEFAVRCGLREPEHGAVIDPRMAREYSVGLAGFEQDSRQ